MNVSLPDIDGLKRAVKMAVAASVAWCLCVLLGEPLPVFAAIVPLVSIRKQEPYSAINVSAGRILGVFVGVLIGLAMLRISDDVTAWLAIATICVSVLVGSILRTGEEPNVQIAVSALIMLFLSDQASSAGVERIWETAVGAAVSTLTVVLLWPPDPLRDLRESIPRIRIQFCDDLEAVVALIDDPAPTDTVLETVRDNQLKARDRAIDLPRVEKSLRWNPLHRKDAAQIEFLTARVVLLARLHRHLRSLARSIADATPDAIEQVRPGYDDLKRSAAAIVDALAPKLDGEVVQGSLDQAAVALDEFAARSKGRLSVVIELDMRRIISDLRTSRVEGSPLGA